MTVRRVQFHRMLDAAEFVDRAKKNLENDWGPLPLGGDDGKKLLVSGLTGYGGKTATLQQISSWPRKFGRLNQKRGSQGSSWTYQYTTIEQ